MRFLGCGSLFLPALFASGLAFGQTPPGADPAPAAPVPAPPPNEPAPPAPSASDTAPPPPPPRPDTNPNAVPTQQSDTAALDERRPATALAASARDAAAKPTANRFALDYEAWPISLAARFGFNARVSSSFGSADDELLDTDFALGAYLAWSREYALGVELEQAGLGRVRALSAQNSVDAEYSATSGWLAARVFPWRSERWDLFLNLRLGLAFQHLDALGTRQDPTLITVPARSFSCTATDGPGIGLGAAIGLDYRIARHVSLVTRLDATGQRLSGDELGTCADGIGSVTSVGGSVGLAYIFESAKR